MTRRSDRAYRRVVMLGAASLALLATWAIATPVLPSLDEAWSAWQALPGSEQSQLQARVDAWDALPQQQRREQRGRYDAWLALEANDRARLRQAAQQFAALPIEEQTRLRTQFEHLDVMAQRGWGLGPELGADWPRLQPLFAYVPPAQRGQVRLALKQLDAAARDDLAALAQRLPPQSRDGFRREFLKVAPPQRAAWLRQRRDQ